LLIDYSSSWVQKPILQGGPLFRGKTRIMDDKRDNFQTQDIFEITFELDA
jgi:hypothetical protein